MFCFRKIMGMLENMVRLIWGMIILLFCATPLYSQDFAIIETVEDLEIKGNVVSVYEKEISVKGTRHDLIPRNVISEIKYLITTDNKVLIDYHRTRGIITQYKYNSKNQIVEVASFYTRDSSSAGKTIYYYDNFGNPTHEIIYSPRSNNRDSVAVTVDKSNNSITKKYFNSKNEVFKTEEKWRNAADKDIKFIQTTNNSTIRIIYEYDSTLTKMLEEKWYLGEKLVQRIKSEYNENGFLVRKIEFDDKNKQSAVIQYDYDILSGLVIEMKTSRNTTNYEYNFDNNGNWITKYEFYDDYPVKIIEREIVYR